MKNFTNPLNNIHVASPCSQDWDAMLGDNRKRFCGECKLNVYNLSGMSRTEAEGLLRNSEGRLCVRFYRRSDGTVLTQDCPVGWQAVKRRVSKTATAIFASIVGIFGGIFSVGFFKTSENNPQISGEFIREDVNVATTGAIISDREPNFIQGNVAIEPQFQEGWVEGRVSRPTEEVVGEIALPVKTKKRSR